MFKFYSLLVLICFSSGIIFSESNKTKYELEKLSIKTSQGYVWEGESYGAYTESPGFFGTSGTGEIKSKFEWTIMRGDVKPLNDFEFLELIGDDKKLSEIQARDKKRKGNDSLGTFFTVIGLIGIFNPDTFGAGLLVALIGGSISKENKAPAHFLDPLEAKEKILKYNSDLKKRYSLE